MRCLHSLPWLLLLVLLLSLGTGFPLLDQRGPLDVAGVIRARMSWGPLAEGHRPHAVLDPSRWPRAPQTQSLFVVAKELQTSRLREHRGSRLRRQESNKGPGSPLGSLAEELSSYSRKKGGFSFRFGR